MIVLRRSLFYVFCAGLIVPLPLLIFGMSEAGGVPISGLIFLICLFGLLIWSIIFLKAEPNLTRAGLILITLIVLSTIMFVVTSNVEP